MSGSAARLRRLAAVLVVATAIGSAGCGRRRPAAGPAWPDIPLAPTDRLLILAPHPDDEVLGCGGILQRAQAMGLPVRVVFFTYGDNNQWSFFLYRRHPVFVPEAVRSMGLVRHDEALAAARILGLPPDALTFLGYPDFGTLHIWVEHWADRPPFRSMLTRVTAVPYANALRPGAPYKGEEIVRDLTAILRAFRPTKVFVSHPGDHMPDHAALYLFTRVALWDLASELQPELYPYLVHFRRWPAPRRLKRSVALEPPALFREAIAWRSHPLRPEELERKSRAIAAHRTQYAASARYLESFLRPNELFGDFPAIALRRGIVAVPLAADRGASRGKLEEEPPEQLTESERAAFVGLETRSVQLDGDQLVISIELSRPLGRAVQASVYVFGYRADRPFAAMPKLHVQVGLAHAAAYDQDRLLPEGTVQIRHTAKALTIRVPLQVLGEPQRILTSAHTSLETIPLDWVSWRILELPPA